MPGTMLDEKIKIRNILGYLLCLESPTQGGGS